MREKVKELMAQAGTDTSGKWMGIDNAEKFAELIVLECADLCESFGESGDGYTCSAEILEHFGVEE